MKYENVENIEVKLQELAIYASFQRFDEIIMIISEIKIDSHEVDPDHIFAFNGTQVKNKELLAYLANHIQKLIVQSAMLSERDKSVYLDKLQLGEEQETSFKEAVCRRLVNIGIKYEFPGITPDSISKFMAMNDDLLITMFELITVHAHTDKDNTRLTLPDKL